MLKNKAKRKKDFLIVGAIALVLISFVVAVFSAFTKVQDDRLIKTREQQTITKKDVSLAPEPAFKEDWAISVENTLEAQDSKITKMVEETRKSVKEMGDNLNKSVTELSTDIKDSQESFQAEIQSTVEDQLGTLKQQIEKQNSKIETLIQDRDTVDGLNELLPKPLSVVIDENNSLNGSTLVGAGESNISAVIGEKVPVKVIPPVAVKPLVKKSTRVSMVELDVSSNEDLIKQESDDMAALDKKIARIKRTYHISTGLSSAYLLTGVYVPAFSAGKDDGLPILIEATGEILHANNEIGSIDKCFLIGAATGEMSTSSAKIRIQQISCVLNGGKQIIEGAVSGWVIGRNGLPNLHGDLLHKNGAWVARTFLSGFLQTAAETLSASAGNQNTTATVGGVATTAAAGGTSTIFQKLGDYYLKMAEQVFPVIEVKAGQEVNVFFRGGETLTVKDVQIADLSDIEDNLKKEAMLRAQKQRAEVVKTSVMQKIQATVAGSSSNAPATVKQQVKKGDLPPLPEIGE